MKPAAFRYLAPSSVEEALAAKAENGDDARFIAGGQSLVPAMNFRLAQPAVLIDLNGVAGLDSIESGAAIHIGAMARNRAVERSALIARALPLVAEAMPHVAHPQIRNRGTLGGNLAHADPASEMPAVMVALDARFAVRSRSRTRSIAARDFYRGVFTTSLELDEMLVGIEVPAAMPRTGTAFLEIARRQGDYAMMGIAVALSLDDRGRCARASLAYFNAGETPMLATRAGAGLAGEVVTAATARAAGAAIQTEIDPRGNVHASVAYQRHLASVLTERALVLAASRAADTGVT